MEASPDSFSYGFGWAPDARFFFFGPSTQNGFLAHQLLIYKKLKIKNYLFKRIIFHSNNHTFNYKLTLKMPDAKRRSCIKTVKESIETQFTMSSLYNGSKLVTNRIQCIESEYKTRNDYEFKFVITCAKVCTF